MPISNVCIVSQGPKSVKEGNESEYGLKSQRMGPKHHLDDELGYYPFATNDVL